MITLESGPPPPCRSERGGGGADAPLTQPSPRQGREGLCRPHRVIASKAKQPRGLTRSYGDVPLGCFGAMRLAMTLILHTLHMHEEAPLPRLRRYFPQRGKISL
jgi:hypothetical protein